MSKKDEFGNRMKNYEKLFTEQCIPPDEYMIVRLDGKNFSKKTKKMNKPFDKQLSSVFEETIVATIEEFNIPLGYNQSDEVTLVFNKANMEVNNPEHFFGGKTHKINSVITSYFSIMFDRLIYEQTEFDAEIIDDVRCFDCRTFGIKDLVEVKNMLLWRIKDCERNSINSIARLKYSSKELFGKNISSVKKMISGYEKDYDEFELYGTLYTEDGIYPATKFQQNVTIENHFINNYL